MLFKHVGQHVFQEIVDLERMGCPPEHLYIDIPPGDFYDPEGTGTVQMPFMRSRYDQVVSGYYTNHPRDQINQVDKKFRFEHEQTLLVPNILKKSVFYMYFRSIQVIVI